jgi:hypothetical protein
MKNQFAKLFELDNHQVLVTKNYDQDETGKDVFLMEVSTSLNSIQPTMKAHYPTEEKRDQQFEKYDKHNAQKFLEHMLLTLES